MARADLRSQAQEQHIRPQRTCPYRKPCPTMAAPRSPWHGPRMIQCPLLPLKFSLPSLPTHSASLSIERQNVRARDL